MVFLLSSTHQRWKNPGTSITTKCRADRKLGGLWHKGFLAFEYWLLFRVPREWPLVAVKAWEQGFLGKGPSHQTLPILGSDKRKMENILSLYFHIICLFPQHHALNNLPFKYWFRMPTSWWHMAQCVPGSITGLCTQLLLILYEVQSLKHIFQIKLINYTIQIFNCLIFFHYSSVKGLRRYNGFLSTF